jgi:hypothetical protein
MPRRGLEEGFIRREDIFHGSGVNKIDSYLLLRSRNLGLHRSWTFLLFLHKNERSLWGWGKSGKKLHLSKNKSESDPDDSVFLFESVMLGEYVQIGKL